MDLELHGKTALITGSERGIGRAIALAFASAGADVVIASLPINKAAIKNMEGVAGEIKKLGQKTLVVPVDVSDEQSVKNLAAETEKTFPQVDILVNNAGTIILPDHILETTVADFDKMIAVNLRSLFLVCQSFIPAMVKRRWGRVINIASSAGLWGLPDRLSYCSSKFGAVGFTSALAIDMKPHNVAVNSICPGAVDTPLTAYSKPDVDKSNWLKPEDIANLALFLASEKAAAVTGSNYKIMG
ncbi:MAG: SDR family NAD(P)-dependent oxidoreductase, partial [Desulfobacterales bacterium]